MWIMVAGPISADDKRERRANLARIAREALAVRAKGHVPIVAHFLAGPLRDAERVGGAQRRYLALCHALTERCDAIYVYASSPGADAERAAFESLGRPVYHRLADVPAADHL